MPKPEPKRCECGRHVYGFYMVGLRRVCYDCWLDAKHEHAEPEPEPDEGDE